MRIKTKRGARRIRNQRVIDRRFVVTDYGGCSYITTGKLYRVTYLGKQHFDIKDDDCDWISIAALSECPHLDFVGTWYHPIR